MIKKSPQSRDCAKMPSSSTENVFFLFLLRDYHKAFVSFPFYNIIFLSTKMPQHKHPYQKKKKKGPAPKHQNTFAWTHNPHSKTTSKILAAPNMSVCRRCHDKIEWRKRYRKYKPRTQPGRCNGCQKRNVRVAYHTICEGCTRTSSKAKALIDKELSNLKEGKEHAKLQACAICVKEIALSNPEGDEDDGPSELMGKISLRERKTIERQLMREDKKSNPDTSNGDEDKDRSPKKLDDADDPLSDDEEDPFLKAIGGADQLLTGEAYQKKLLQKQQLQQSVN
jgi:predicted CXXCH cytochrome family protein